MKKLSMLALAIIAVAAFPLAGSKAFAQASMYITPKFLYSYQMIDPNWSFIDSENDSVMGGAIAFGWNFNTTGELPVRLEIEGAMRGESKVKSSSFGVQGDMKNSIYTIFVNGFYDIYTDTPLTPYIGIGLGMAYVDYDLYASNGNISYKYSGDNYNFAWNVGAGLAYQLNDALALDLNYRYAGFGKVDKDDFSADLSAHEVLLGLRISID